MWDILTDFSTFRRWWWSGARSWYTTINNYVARFAPVTNHPETGGWRRGSSLTLAYAHDDHTNVRVARQYRYLSANVCVREHMCVYVLLGRAAQFVKPIPPSIPSSTTVADGPRHCSRRRVEVASRIYMLRWRARRQRVWSNGSLESHKSCLFARDHDVRSSSSSSSSVGVTCGENRNIPYINPRHRSRDGGGERRRAQRATVAGARRRNATPRPRFGDRSPTARVVSCDRRRTPRAAAPGYHLIRPLTRRPKTRKQQSRRAMLSPPNPHSTTPPLHPDVRRGNTYSTTARSRKSLFPGITINPRDLLHTAIAITANVTAL